MISGIVTAEIEAVVALRVRGPRNREFTTEVVIDTGFNGFLTLPANVIVDLELSFAGITIAELGDGSLVRTSAFKVWISWDGNEVEARALEAEGGVLLGMSLLHGHRFTMDVLEGGAVTITPLRELAVST